MLDRWFSELVKDRKNMLSNKGRKKNAEGRKRHRKNRRHTQRRSQARKLGFVSLTGNPFRNPPEFRAMVGSLEKERDHRRNVGTMPGK